MTDDDGALGGPELDETDDHLIGERLREARETLGLTQADVAGALGIQRTSLVAMEAGRRKVSGLELRRLARIYRRSIEWLLGEQTPEISADDALFHAASELSDEDKAQVLRFAQFLASAGAPRTRNDLSVGRDRSRPAPEEPG
jgi:transcriptional regulator with XRE-family HTH domain